MGFHIPDTPSEENVATSTLTTSIPSVQPLRRRRNAIIPIRDIDTSVGLPNLSSNNQPVDGRTALLQFQAELRRNGQLGEITAKEPPSIRRASDIGTLH